MSPTLVLANDFAQLWDTLEGPALAAMQRVGRSGWFILGKEVQAFESSLGKAWGLNHAVGCANGMDAIEISLRAGGLPVGARVLTTPLSAFATTGAILRAGGVPQFIDTDERGLMDLQLLESALQADSTLRWVVPVHLYGQCLNLTTLARLRDTYKLKIMEDCAQSIGATWLGKPCGSVGIAAATSFYPTKNLGAMGDGGALLTNDASLAAAARCWRDYGQSAKYVHALAGLNSRLDELQAAILLDAVLPLWGKFTHRRQAIAAFYRAHLHHPHLTCLPVAAAEISVAHLFPVIVRGSRQAFLAHLQAHHIQAATHYPSLIPDQPALALTGLHLPVARHLAAHVVSLPIHPFLTDVELQRVVSACHAWDAE